MYLTDYCLQCSVPTPRAVTRFGLCEACGRENMEQKLNEATALNELRRGLSDIKGKGLEGLKGLNSGPTWLGNGTAEKSSNTNVKPQTANAAQYGGTHYLTKTIQPWDFITANDIGFLEGCAIKYLSRWRDKGGLDDIRKAIHFCEKLIEVEEVRALGRAQEGKLDKPSR